MLCENCKTNVATTHIKRTVNGITKEYFLCKSCANKLGVNSFNFFDSFFINLNQTQKQQKVCESCKSTYQDIIDKGRMGCPACYNVFKDEIIPSLLKIQKNVQHVGRTPKNYKNVNLDKNEISDLESKLKQAIINEEYEIAAEIRDEIRLKRGEINE